MVPSIFSIFPKAQWISVSCLQDHSEMEWLFWWAFFTFEQLL